MTIGKLELELLVDAVLAGAVLAAAALYSYNKNTIPHTATHVQLRC